MLKLNKEILKQYTQIKIIQAKLKKKEALIKELILKKNKEKFRIDNYLVTVKKFETEVKAHTRFGKRISVKKCLHTVQHLDS